MKTTTKTRPVRNHRSGHTVTVTVTAGAATVLTSRGRRPKIIYRRARKPDSAHAHQGVAEVQAQLVVPGEVAVAALLE